MNARELAEQALNRPTTPEPEQQQDHMPLNGTRVTQAVERAMKGTQQ